MFCNGLICDKKNKMKRLFSNLDVFCTDANRLVLDRLLDFYCISVAENTKLTSKSILNQNFYHRVQGRLTTLHPRAQGILTKVIHEPTAFLSCSCYGFCQGQGCAVVSYHWGGKPGKVINLLIITILQLPRLTI